MGEGEGPSFGFELEGLPSLRKNQFLNQKILLKILRSSYRRLSLQA